MLWACFCIEFFDFLRAGEFTVTPTISSRDCLQVSNVSVDKLPFPSFVRLFTKVAKSDPFRTSCVIVVGRNDSLLFHLIENSDLVYLRYSLFGNYFNYTLVAILNKLSYEVWLVFFSSVHLFCLLSCIKLVDRFAGSES